MPDQPREWFRFVAAKAKDEPTEIQVYGDIGTTFFGDGVSPQEFVDQLSALDKGAALDVRINSLGGSAWDGLTIANALIRHEGTVTTYIDGVAASAASLVALAGDEVVTSKYGQAMVHGAMAVALGVNAKEMREMAAQMDGVDASMAQYYADRCGGTTAEWARAMAKETWFNADEMKAAGMATRIDTSAVRDEVERAAATAMANTREQIRYRGRTAAPAPALLRAQPSEEGRMADKKSLAASLGLPEDASEDDILAEARKALGVKDDPKPDEQPDPANPPVPELERQDPTPTPPAAPAPQPAAAKDGTVVLDEATYQQLMANSQMGAQAHATLQAQADERVIMAAIDQGKIPLARKAHYMTLMRADRADTTDLLTNRLAPGAAVPLQEVGHCADTTPSAQVTEDPRFKAWTI